MLCVMQKSFNAGGESVRPGQILDVSEWKNIDALIENRYMRRATKQEINEAEEVPDTRPTRPKTTIKSGVKVKIKKSLR